MWTLIWELSSFLPPEMVMTEHTKPIKTPSNWGADGMSKGKQTGPVRPTPDAYAPKKK